MPGGIPCPTTYNAILYAALEASSALQGACSSMHYVSLSGGPQGGQLLCSCPRKHSILISKCSLLGASPNTPTVYLFAGTVNGQTVMLRVGYGMMRQGGALRHPPLRSMFHTPYP